jgi:hypothetical protein
LAGRKPILETAMQEQQQALAAARERRVCARLHLEWGLAQHFFQHPNKVSCLSGEVT